MGNTSNKENKKFDFKKASDTPPQVFTSTKISIPNETRDDHIAEDQISILELFTNKDICILILKEKTFTGDFKPLYYIQIYYYDSSENQFIIVLNHTIKDELHHIQKAVYDPHHNYILLYNTLKDISDGQNKFLLFKFEFLTSNNPKLGMNGYNMTNRIHPHINFFGKCRYATFLRKATELLFVFEKGYFILLTWDIHSKQYAHIHYFSTRSSYKYLTKRRKKSSSVSDTSQSNPKKKKRGYRVMMASVHEKRNRITWIECEYNHYYLQIVSLHAILQNKRKPIVSNYAEPDPSSTHMDTNGTNNALNMTSSVPSLSSLSKKMTNSRRDSSTDPVIKITPTSIDIQQYLIVSRLIFANKQSMDRIRCVFGEEYDLEQFQNPIADDYGATKYRGVIRKQPDSIMNDNAQYVLNSFFGINPSSIKLQFNRDGDKIFYQSSGSMLHNDYDSISHGDQYSGNLNDYGALHVVDVTTGNSLWSLGSSSKDIGFGWFNSYLIVLPSIKSASGLAASKSIYNPNKDKKTRSLPSCSTARRKHSHLQMFGFVSETSIAETIYNNCENVSYINEFSWDLCVLLAVYCGGMREYRQLSLTKWMKAKSNDKHGAYPVSNLKLINNEILSVWNTNDNYFNLHRSEKRDWLIVAIKEYRNTLRYIDIIFYDAKKIAMHEHDIFIPYNNNDGLICRNLLGNSHRFDALYYSHD